MLLADYPGQNHDREADISDNNQGRYAASKYSSKGVDPWAVDPKALKHAPSAVHDMETEGEVGDDVHDGHGHSSETGYDVFVWLPFDEGLRGDAWCAQCEVHQVPRDEEQYDRSAPPHGPRCVPQVRRHLTLAAALVRHWSGLLVGPGQRVRRVEMYYKGSCQHRPEDPKEHGFWKDGCSEPTQELAVFVHVERVLIEVQVADHVGDHEPEQGNPRKRHDPLFANVALIKGERPGEGPLLRAFNYCHVMSFVGLVIVCHRLGLREPTLRQHFARFSI